MITLGMKTHDGECGTTSDMVFSLSSFIENSTSMVNQWKGCVPELEAAAKRVELENAAPKKQPFGWHREE